MAACCERVVPSAGLRLIKGLPRTPACVDHNYLLITNSSSDQKRNHSHIENKYSDTENRCPEGVNNHFKSLSKRPSRIGSFIITCKQDSMRSEIN